MALSKHELREILTHAREVMRRHRLFDLDKEAITAVEGGDDPLQNLVTYLKGISAQARFSTQKEYSRTMSRFNQFARTEDGFPFSGIDLALTGPDAELFGAKTLHLDGAPKELDEAVEAILAVIHELLSAEDSQQ